MAISKFASYCADCRVGKGTLLRAVPTWKGPRWVRFALPTLLIEQRAKPVRHAVWADTAGSIYQALPPEPRVKFRRWTAAEQVAHRQRVVERGALIAQHNIVSAGYSHHEIDARRHQQRQQRVRVILIGLGVVGVADIDAHRHAHELAAEMILQSGARDLLAVEQIFRPDKADDRVDQQRLEVARNGVGPCFDGLLV